MYDADMAGLTAIRPRDRLHALRPFPARLEREPGCRRAATHANHVHFRLLRCARLIGGVEAAFFDACHPNLLSARYLGLEYSHLVPFDASLAACAHLVRRITPHLVRSL